MSRASTGTRPVSARRSSFAWARRSKRWPASSARVAPAIFDLAFIDADKAEYDAYYEGALPLVRKGGLIAFDNMLWTGKVADRRVKDADTRAIRALNKKITREDDRVEAVLLPVGDGMLVARRVR